MSVKRMSSPPIVGVPALTWWLCGPTSRMFWPTDSRRSVAMKRGPRSSARRIAVTTAPAVRKVM